ncbi:MAG TPA: cohesin domain-containing protein [Candidatus Woesebacteria bacterium]|nr:cohesin domain-containing protein [Candidatus Woesebacteria bacterium]
MKKMISSFVSSVFFACLLFLISGVAVASPASAAVLKLNPSSGNVTKDSQIQVIVDTENATAESAVAVITFDSTKVEITKVTAGNFFDSVATDTSKAGEVAITGTMNIGNIEGKTGSGTLATLTINPKITSGTFTLGFRCSAASIDDSNIMSTDNSNLLATDEQCARNVAGTYTVAATSNDDPAPTATPTPSSSNNNNTQNPTNTPAPSKGGQPSLPSELPQSGPEHWLQYLMSGLAVLGIGLLLL